MKSLYRLDWGG